MARAQPPTGCHKGVGWRWVVHRAHLAACTPGLRVRAPNLRVLGLCPEPAVRIGYPCFGTPRRVNGKIVG